MSEWQATAQALLIRAERDDIPKPEKNALLSDAAQTLASASIDEAALAAANQIVDVVQQQNFSFTAPYAAQKADVFRACAKFNRCKFEKIANESSVYSITGYEQDVARADWMYHLFIEHGTKIISSIPSPYWENGRSYHINLWVRYTNRLSDVLLEAQEKAEVAATTGNSRILRDRWRDVKNYKKAA